MKTLVLIPTDMERRAIQSSLPALPEDWQVEVVGFGVVAAAIRTAELIGRLKPSKVIVAGIAGVYCDAQVDLVGDAFWFDEVSIDGIGIGQGDQFRSATELGWNWYNSDSDDGVSLKLDRPELLTNDSRAMKLLTVCAASVSIEEAEQRRKRYTGAFAEDRICCEDSVCCEDMESFAVALACKRSEIPVQVLRGISNVAGNRDKTTWQIGAALHAVANEIQKAIIEQ
ncbi:futalosine hydrolase [Stieleria sp. JC731]|uniref:futalosine hydrolase n=1 Tax=Pirellulaceae TaxID=2691357 RepID=UPI001E5512DB|nr:futalosine hydrolase [Stieleria sp. JC731]MCC9601873.1 futalosine hydrolase [Stieleria sp. JC731]